MSGPDPCAEREAPPARTIPIGSFVARVGNALVTHRRKGKRAHLLVVGEWLGTQLFWARRYRVHGLDVTVDKRLRGYRVAITDTLATLDEHTAQEPAT